MEATTASATAITGKRVRPPLLDYNIIWGVAAGIGGYFLGHYLGARIGSHLDAQSMSDQDDIAIFAGMILATVGFLLGLGFFAYPLSRIGPV